MRRRSRYSRSREWADIEAEAAGDGYDVPTARQIANGTFRKPTTKPTKETPNE